MPRIPQKVARRLSFGLKQFQPILESAKSRDVNESDTVVIVADILSEIFGYDKYNEVTSEYAIKGTYCDLAIKLNGKLHYLIEVKAIGSDLKVNHIKQAIDYAANEGVDWVLLTNGITWRVDRVSFTKPISNEQVIELDFLSLNHRSAVDIQSLFLLSREAIKKSALPNYHEQVQATNRFLLGALILADPVINTIRREVKRISPGIQVDPDEILKTLQEEVLKREVAHGDRAEEASKQVKKVQTRALRKKVKKLDPTQGNKKLTQETPVENKTTERSLGPVGE